MSLETVTLLTTVCFAFAAGIFTVLSFIEKPVWALMRAPNSSRATDDESRRVHEQLRRLIRLLPPAMKTTMGSAAGLILYQSWMRGFDRLSFVPLTVFVSCMAYLLFHLESRIRAVADTPSDGEIGVVRSGLGRLAALHHVGLGTAVSMVVLQLMLAAWG